MVMVDLIADALAKLPEERGSLLYSEAVALKTEIMRLQKRETELLERIESIRIGLDDTLAKVRRRL